MNDPVFLGEKGITSTSANYLANLAQELIVKDKELLDEPEFYNAYVDIIGSDAQPKQVTIGKNNDYVKNIPEVVMRIAKMNAFCAWVREAIKAKDELTNAVKNASIYSHPDWKDKIPQRPIHKSAIGVDMNIKERCEYLSLEAYASAIGKIIHDKGTFNMARKDAHKMAVNPLRTSGTGTETLIYTYSPSADLEVIDSTYEQLQNLHRQYEARLNAIKFKNETMLAEENLKLKAEYDQKLNAYEAEVSRMLTDFTKWQTEESQRISKLKIQIPNELQETYEYLNSVGNKVADS